MIFAPGATSQSLDILIVDDTGLPVTGLVAATFPTLTYSRAGANADVSFPALSDLATITTAYASGGVKERGNGRYRLDVPDAMLATAGKITVRGEATNKRVIMETVEVGYVSTNTIQHAGTAQTAGDIVDLLNDLDAQIGTGTATVTAPVASSGAVTVYYADDYDNDESRAIEFTDTDGNWPTLTGATVTLNVWSKRAGPILLSVTGSVIVATGANKQVRFEPTSANTDDLQIGDYYFAVVATLTNLRRVTLVADDYHVRGVADT